jgi:hypothetical protein
MEEMITTMIMATTMDTTTSTTINTNMIITMILMLKTTSTTLKVYKEKLTNTLKILHAKTIKSHLLWNKLTKSPHVKMKQTN